MNDWELLQQYVRKDSRQAMDELVRRHMAMVYAAALRELGDPHLAEDVSQAVFIVLLRRAATLSRRVILAGWLFNATRYAAANALRSRRRRDMHERKAAEMKPDITPPAAAGENAQILPLLNSAVAALPTHDRDAVVMRYLQGKSCGEVAVALNISEDTARQRLHRALIKLRRSLGLKGLALSEETLGAALIAAGTQSVPVHLAAHLAAAIHAPAAGSAATLADSTIRILMTSAKVKILTTTGAAALVLILGASTAVHFMAPSPPMPVQVVSTPAPAQAPEPAPSAMTIAPTATPPPLRLDAPLTVTGNAIARPGYPRSSPFQAIRWNGQDPEVKVNGNWYALIAINDVPAADIVRYSMQRERDIEPLAKKHFNEDLPEVMASMGHKLADTVDLHLRDLATSEDRTMTAVAMSELNRQAILQSDVADPSINAPKTK